MMNKISPKKVTKNHINFTIPNTVMDTLQKVTERILTKQRIHFNHHSTVKTPSNNQAVPTLTTVTSQTSSNLATNLPTQMKVGKST